MTDGFAIDSRRAHITDLHQPWNVGDLLLDLGHELVEHEHEPVALAASGRKWRRKHHKAVEAFQSIQISPLSQCVRPF